MAALSPIGFLVAIRFPVARKTAALSPWIVKHARRIMNFAWASSFMAGWATTGERGAWRGTRGIPASDHCSRQSYRAIAVLSGRASACNLQGSTLFGRLRNLISWAA